MVTVSENREHEAHGGGKRGKITSFSKDARYRLFRLLHSLNFERIAFVTLTYGRTYPTDPRTAKSHLKAFRRATERRYGNIRAIWRMEFQARGAPHFHILYLDPPIIPVQAWCVLWDKCRKSPIDEIFGNSLDIKYSQGGKSSNMVGAYLGKYIAKIDERSNDEIEEGIGRIWGRWNIEDPEPIEVEVNAEEAERLAKLLLPPPEAPGWHPLSTDSYTVFGGQMGKNDLRDQVLWELGMLLNYTRRLEKKVVTFNT